MFPHWVKVTGIVVEGYKVASGMSSPISKGTIVRQIPFFKQCGLDLSAFHPATLNISITPKILIVARPRHTFRWVKWLPDHRPEDFSFSPCRMRFGGHEHNAFIYYPHPETKLGHPHPPSIIEIIAPFIVGIENGASVDLYLNTEEVALLDAPKGSLFAD